MYTLGRLKAGVRRRNLIVVEQLTTTCSHYVDRFIGFYQVCQASDFTAQCLLKTARGWSERAKE